MSRLLKYRRDHSEIVADTVVEFIQQDFCRPLSGHRFFERFSLRLARDCEGKTDEHEHNKGQKILRGRQPTVGRQKRCNAQRGAEDGRVKTRASIKENRRQEDAGAAKGRT